MAQNKKPKDKFPTKQLYFNQVVRGSRRWPKSTVHEKATISKRAGCKKYVLEPKEIEDLEFKVEMWNDPATGQPRRAHLYRERDLEQRARAKYNGPISLAIARRRQALRTAGRAPQSSFSQAPPAFTMPFSSTSRSNDGAGGDSECGDDMPKMNNLADMEAYLKGVGKGWLWNRLDATFQDTFGLEGAVPELRSQVILAAQGPFMSRYPIRHRGNSIEPSLTMRPLSKSFANLYKILDDALMTINRTKAKKDKITKKVISKPDWTTGYYDKVYRALSTITKSHGPQGWKEARWLVYDKYVQCKFGSVYVIMTRGPPNGLGIWEWGDNAAFWLHQEEYKMGPFLKDPFLKLFTGK